MSERRNERLYLRGWTEPHMVVLSELRLELTRDLIRLVRDDSYFASCGGQGCAVDRVRDLEAVIRVINPPASTEASRAQDAYDASLPDDDGLLR